MNLLVLFIATWTVLPEAELIAQRGTHNAIRSVIDSNAPDLFKLAIIGQFIRVGDDDKTIRSRLGTFSDFDDFGGGSMLTFHHSGLILVTDPYGRVDGIGHGSSLNDMGKHRQTELRWLREPNYAEWPTEPVWVIIP